MISQISISSKIYDFLYKAKDTQDNEFTDALKWITDIMENPNRTKQNQCEICSSNKKLAVHHVKGCKFGNEVITVCYECHKTLTDKQRLWDKSWLEPDSKNNSAFLIRGFIDICELKYQKTCKGIYKLFAEKLTEGFSYE